jgi:uncharacterized RDD family membrane protein YckC/DNA-directed RNA polymerase subunit RPC12/RpoP
MSIAFDCPRCGRQVVLQYLGRGDEAQCPGCGARVNVPETAMPADARPRYRLRDAGVPPQGTFPLRAHQSPDETDQLATRLSRLAASIVDGLVMMVFALPLYFILFTRYPGSIFDAGDTFRILWIGIPSLLFFIGVNSYFWATRGQSVGKMALAIRIVQIDGRPATWGRIVGLRVMPIQLIGWIPFLGGVISLVDILMIFRSNRRCLHDEIARTKVVKCNPDSERRAKWQEDPTRS